VLIDNKIDNRGFEISKFSIKKLKKEIDILKTYIKTNFNTLFNTI